MTGLLRNRRCLFSVSQRGDTAPIFQICFCPLCSGLRRQVEKSKKDFTAVMNLRSEKAAFAQPNTMSGEPVTVHGLSITWRTALSAWAVALGTLLIFDAAIIPLQKQVLVEDLRSNAHVVATVLCNVAVGSAVTGDR